jgi:hypothetical protein
MSRADQRRASWLSAFGHAKTTTAQRSTGQPGIGDRQAQWEADMASSSEPDAGETVPAPVEPPPAPPSIEERQAMWAAENADDGDTDTDGDDELAAEVDALLDDDDDLDLDEDTAEEEEDEEDSALLSEKPDLESGTKADFVAYLTEFPDYQGKETSLMKKKRDELVELVATTPRN